MQTKISHNNVKILIRFIANRRLYSGFLSIYVLLDFL